MFVRPSLFHEFLEKSLYDQIYEAMKKDDMAEVVMIAADILKETDTIPSIKQEKSEMQSDTLRAAGNENLSNGDYTKALEFYNEALLYAPKNSRAMKLAYSNRSYILLKASSFRACITDIDRCFSMGCPPDIKDKLLKRREEANKYVLMESLAYNSLKGFSKDYFKFTAVRNSDVPCVSAKVNIEVDITQPRVTAATEINAGTIISYEEPYMASVSHENHLTSCYYCLQILPNMIPCESCCYALFCSEDCKNKCKDEYHKYECNMMALICHLSLGIIPNLMIKSVLKMKTKVNSWKELIKASKKLGNDRIKKSSSKEVFDDSSDYSVLSFHENRVFIYGRMYNASFVCAALLQGLSEIPGFLPNTDKELALRALAKIMMHLLINGPSNYVIQAANAMISKRSGIRQDQSLAYYTFYGNLKTSCISNVIVSFTHNKAALIAIRKIDPGEEIVSSCLLLSENLNSNSCNMQSYLLRGTVCVCSKCKGDFRRDVLSPTQKEYFEKVNVPALEAKFDAIYVKEIFDKVVKVMDVLSNVQNSREYMDAYFLFRKCLVFFEIAETNNFMIR